MGEIAEMMLDGTLCECCGVFLGACEGFPVRCAACTEDEGPGIDPGPPPRRRKRNQRERKRLKRKQRERRKAREKPQ